MTDSPEASDRQYSLIPPELEHHDFSIKDKELDLLVNRKYRELAERVKLQIIIKLVVFGVLLLAAAFLILFQVQDDTFRYGLMAAFVLLLVLYLGYLKDRLDVVGATNRLLERLSGETPEPES